MPDATVDGPPAELSADGSRRRSAPGSTAESREQEHEKQPEAGDSGVGETPVSPPLPARHVPITAGPRAARLQDIYAQALRHTLSKLAAWDNFAGCYPTVAARAETVLRQVQGQMVNRMREKCEKEFENILVARNVVVKLNELESLIDDASARRKDASSSAVEPIPPHLLPPPTILSAHLSPALAPHQSLLNAKLQTTQSQNALLADHVRGQHAEIEDLLARLEAAADDVRSANRALGAVASQIAEEARDAVVGTP
ncbi:hypothetical protein RJ55_03050 [Drechmeria coniospora]|nr:hypothetical protein RJ55_03050 [Drechmeria coniospora]